MYKRTQALKSCPAHCNSMDCSLPGSSVHGIFQTRTLEWVAISSSRGSSQGSNQVSGSSCADRWSPFPLEHLASYLLVLPSVSRGIFFETCASNKLSTPNSLCGCFLLNVQSLVHVMGTAPFHDLQTRGDLKPKPLFPSGLSPCL